jgi:N-acyl-D-amino-acid deacylase
MAHDLKVRGGLVVDGTGAPARTADVALSDGLIVGVGNNLGAARRVIDADGALVTPGWVDAHTHYDGQVTWDDRLEGSATNGVTTIVMGNCGVGFAPVEPGAHAVLVDLMEGVEDIPGAALDEGIPWGSWESFPEYLSVLDERRWSLDVGALLPHGALRLYVMHERAINHERATAEDLARMVALTEDAIRAGALGMSTSRIIGHRAMSGFMVPGTFAADDELLALALAVRAGGGGILQAVPAGGVRDLDPSAERRSVFDELRLLGRASREAQIPVTFSMLQVRDAPTLWRDILAAANAENLAGAELAPMVALRAITLLSTLAGHHLFQRRPTYLRLSGLPHDELVRQLRDPAVRAAIMSETDVPDPRPGSMETVLPFLLGSGLTSTFTLRDPINYEPLLDGSIAAQATARGIDPAALCYDLLLEGEGTAVLVCLGSGYVDGDLEASRTMLIDRNTVPGLSDAGAHVSFVCDMSSPTFMLTHWVRDRVRGERLPLEFVVAKATSRVAQLFGLHDRGTIEVGRRADLNVIDFDRLHIGSPVLRHDLPAGGRRYVQPSTGYLATIVGGAPTREHDEDTGARPGRVARRT